MVDADLAKEAAEVGEPRSGEIALSIAEAAARFVRGLQRSLVAVDVARQPTRAIMLINFALDAERHQQISPGDAIYKAYVLRFWPILMTTMVACP